MGTLFERTSGAFYSPTSSELSMWLCTPDLDRENTTSRRRDVTWENIDDFSDVEEIPVLCSDGSSCNSSRTSSQLSSFRSELGGSSPIEEESFHWKLAGLDDIYKFEPCDSFLEDFKPFSENLTDPSLFCLPAHFRPLNSYDNKKHAGTWDFIAPISPEKCDNSYSWGKVDFGSRSLPNSPQREGSSKARPDRKGEIQLRDRGRCGDCGKSFKNLKVHMFTHQAERPIKCPLTHCYYHVKGFARKYDKNRHTLTHFQGSMICGYCTCASSSAEKSFTRVDVFKRHLISDHGAVQLSPTSRKNNASYFCDTRATCSVCSSTFTNVQLFFNHLDDCIINTVINDFHKESTGVSRVSKSIGWSEATNEHKSKSIPQYHPAGLDVSSSCGDQPNSLKEIDIGLPESDAATTSSQKDAPESKLMVNSVEVNLANNFIHSKGKFIESLVELEGSDPESRLTNDKEISIPEIPGRDTQPVASPCSDSISTDSSPGKDSTELYSDEESVSDCSTDWDVEERSDRPNNEIYSILADSQDHALVEEDQLLRPILSPMKQALVDRVMAEFWVIFNQEWVANVTRCTGQTPASSGSPGISASQSGSSPSQSAGRKRARDDGDEPPPGGNNDRTPKRPSPRIERVVVSKSHVKFACPYRKHSPNSYTIHNYRSCALSHWETVARVKEHLFRRHRAPIQCKRCWRSFKTQESLDTHLTVVDVCALSPGQPAEGITSELEKRLRSRKKSSPNQTEEARWREIYGILFPNEAVPDPYFEPVQETVQSPDSIELAGYEEYSRRELPRVLRSYLEHAVHNETQQLEEHLRGHLISIVQDCQDRIFSSYRSRLSLAGGRVAGSGRTPGDSAITPPSSQGIPDQASSFHECQSKDRLSSVYQAATPQSTLLYLPELQNMRSATLPPVCSAEISFSDSGYISNPQASSPNTPKSSANEKLSNKQGAEIEDSHHVPNYHGSQFSVPEGVFGDTYDPEMDFNHPDLNWL